MDWNRMEKEEIKEFVDYTVMLARNGVLEKLINMVANLHPVACYIVLKIAIEGLKIDLDTKFTGLREKIDEVIQERINEIQWRNLQ